MVENEFNYYYIRRKGDKAYPLIKVVGAEEDDDGGIVLMELQFNSPVPPNPVLADYLSGPDVFLSKRIIEKIKSLQPEGVLFVPTELTDTKGNKTDDYIAVLPGDDNYYEAMDKERSKYEIKHGGYWIDKLALNTETLKKIPLKERLIFALSELPGKTLFHKSVADAIIELEPTGMVFVNIEDYEL